MKIAVGSDHAGFKMKEAVKEHLRISRHEVIDVGTFSEDSVDYPDYAAAAAGLVSKDEAERAILVCGTGIGMAITANKFSGVRAAVADTPELAKRSREHNDTNVLALGSRIIDNESAALIVDIWLETEFEGGRHQTRIDKIEAIEREKDA